MPTYPLSTLAPTVDASGISAPTYSDIYQSLIASFQAIYGSSIYVAADSQDGQWIAVLAKAIDDSNQAAISVFRSFSPVYSQGTDLDSLIKLNGLSRQVSSYSTAQGNVVGQAGTIITNGVVQDINGNLWNLPASVTIPIGGSIVETVTAQSVGNVIAPSGTINTIATPQFGWQSFTSTIDAVPGNPIETDAQVRARQAISTALPALSIKESIEAAIGNVSGVSRFIVYENDTGSVDINGIPAHSFSAVVLGGDANAIGAAIASKKPPGIQTYGPTTVTVYDSKGFASSINFYPLSLIQIYFGITIKALTGYVATTATLIATTLANFVNSLAIGEDVYASQAQAAASLIQLGLGQTFYITVFTLGTSASPSGTSNITVAFNFAATSQASNVAVTVT